MLLLVWSFGSALFLVLSAANSILRDPTHSPLITCPKHMLLCCISSGPTSFTECWVCLDIFCNSWFCNSWFSKTFVILYVMQHNVTLMWYQSHKRNVLQDVNVSAHHWVTAWISWYQQPFYWSWNINTRGGEMSDWSVKEEEIASVFSAPKSVTGQVFTTVRALDTISTSASPSECITLIPERRIGCQAFQEMLVCYVYGEETHLFSQSMNYGKMIQFFFVAFFYYAWYAYCPL